jgi:hypothetical protein
MKKNQKTLRLLATAFLFAMAAFVTSCKKDEDPFSAEVNQTVNNESTQDAQQDEVDDMATAQLSVSDPAGRIATTEDGRVTCAKITAEIATDKSSGTVVIDFDTKPNGDPNPDGCTDPRGNKRKGKITIHWEGGRWFHVGAIITITLNNYSINGVVINGTRSLHNVTTNILSPTWTVTAEHTAMWPNGETASRTVHKTRVWNIAAGTITVTKTDGADNAASGTNRHGKSYTVQITAGVVFKLSCADNKVYLPVSGTKVITFDSKVVTIDFGSGDCDNTFTVTFENKSRVVTAKNDDSAD